MPTRHHREFEARFLEIARPDLVTKLRQLGATERAETLLEERIFYDEQFRWRDEKKFVRVRSDGAIATLSYKHHQEAVVGGAEEVEVIVSDFEETVTLLQNIGLRLFRRQEKRRHSFRLNGCQIDIDTWPGVPAYVELEAEDEDIVKKTAAQLGLPWEQANTHDAAWVLEHVYHIPVRTLGDFTFESYGH